MLQKLLAALAVALACAATAHAQTADVAHFVDPISARSAALSPDGAYIAFIRRSDADEQIVVIDLANRSGRAIQRIVEAEGSYLWVGWKNNTRLLVGAELTETIEGGRIRGSHRHAADQEVSTASVLALNRDGSGFMQMFDGQIRRSLRGSTFLLDPLPNDPDGVLLIAEDNVGRGVWRADVNTGRAERVDRGPPGAIEYVTDGAGYPVIRVDALADNSGFRIHRRASGATDWIMAIEARREAAAPTSADFNVVAAGPGPGQVYVLARTEGRDLSALYLYDTATGALGEPLFTPAQADADMPWIHPTTRQLIARCEFAQRLACQGRDATIQRQLGAVEGFFERQATVRLVDMSDDENRWLLAVDGPTEAGGFYLFDRVAGRVSPVADMHPNVNADALSPTETISYAARDGAQLWAYVTARPGATGPRPMIVLPHGGPESRDYYGYDSFAQFLASRGYVVLQPNFRGSAGFGRAFADAGRGQWGGTMQNDVTDAVRHMIASGAADASRVCIVGASYGGYAALAGAALTPDLYRCAVSIAGVSDLAEIVTRTSTSGSATRHYWMRSIGDPGSNRAALDAVSPRHLAGQITAPVLLIHGEEDDVVEIRQSELMQQALGRRSRLVRLPDEGHYWDEWTREHRLQVYREVERFLAEHNPAQ
jgi:dipeptidyl aminopeptidase/acylaminoacyl peptidase